MQGIERGSLALCQQSHSSHFPPPNSHFSPAKMFSQFYPVLVILCIPFSLPSFYIVYRLFKRRCLSSVFNEHVALMMIFSGKGRVQKKGISTIFQFSLIKGNYFLYMLLLAIYFRDDPPFQPGHSNPEAADGQLSRRSD